MGLFCFFLFLFVFFWAYDLGYQAFRGSMSFFFFFPVNIGFKEPPTVEWAFLQLIIDICIRSFMLHVCRFIAIVCHVMLLKEWSLGLETA